MKKHILLFTMLLGSIACAPTSDAPLAVDSNPLTDEETKQLTVKNVVGRIVGEWKGEVNIYAGYKEEEPGYIDSLFASLEKKEGNVQDQQDQIDVLLNTILDGDKFASRVAFVDILSHKVATTASGYVVDVEKTIHLPNGMEFSKRDHDAFSLRQNGDVTEIVSADLPIRYAFPITDSSIFIWGINDGVKQMMVLSAPSPGLDCWTIAVRMQAPPSAGGAVTYGLGIYDSFIHKKK